MLPLAADRAPANAEELSEALRSGLLAGGLAPRAIGITGAEFPVLDEVRLDLSEARLTRDFRPPAAVGEKVASLRAAQLEISAQPILLEETPVMLRLQLQDATVGLTFSGNRGSLVLEQAAAGELAAEVASAAMETALHRLAVEAAARQGVEVRQTKLSLHQESPGAISFRVEVTAKLFIMSAVLALAGRLDVDDALNLKLSGLALDGDSMILKLVGGMAKPHLDKLEGRTISLGTFTPAGMKVRSLELTAGSQLKLRAVLAAG